MWAAAVMCAGWEFGVCGAGLGMGLFRGLCSFWFFIMGVC